MDPVFAEGEDVYKAGVHLGLFGLAIAAALYNAGVLLSRAWTWRHAANVLVYGSLAIWEASAIAGHLRAAARGPR
jgi:hypothetical protein